MKKILLILSYLFISQFLSAQSIWLKNYDNEKKAPYGETEYALEFTLGKISKDTSIYFYVRGDNSNKSSEEIKFDVIAERKMDILVSEETNSSFIVQQEDSLRIIKSDQNLLIKIPIKAEGTGKQKDVIYVYCEYCVRKSRTRTITIYSEVESQISAPPIQDVILLSYTDNSINLSKNNANTKIDFGKLKNDSTLDLTIKNNGVSDISLSPPNATDGFRFINFTKIISIKSGERHSFKLCASFNEEERTNEESMIIPIKGSEISNIQLDLKKEMNMNPPYLLYIITVLCGIIIPLIFYCLIIPLIRRFYLIKTLKALKKNFTGFEKSKNKNVRIHFLEFKQELINGFNSIENTYKSSIGLNANEEFLINITNQILDKINTKKKNDVTKDFNDKLKNIEDSIIEEFKKKEARSNGRKSKGTKPRNYEEEISRLESDAEKWRSKYNELNNIKYNSVPQEKFLVAKKSLEKRTKELEELKLKSYRETEKNIQRDEKINQLSSDLLAKTQKLSALDVYPPFMEAYFNLINETYSFFKQLNKKVPENSIFKPAITSLLKGQVLLPQESQVFDVVKKDKLITQVFNLKEISEIRNVNKEDFISKFITSYSLNVLDNLAQLYAYSRVDQRDGISLYNQMSKNACQPDEIVSLFDKFQSVLSEHFSFKMFVPLLFEETFNTNLYEKTNVSSSLIQLIRKDIISLENGLIYDLVRVGFRPNNIKDTHVPNKNATVIYRAT